MLFSSFDNSKTIFVPEEDIAKVIQMAEEKEKEEKEKKEGDDTTAGSSSSNTWVDVDLTNQIVTLYVDGVAIMSSPALQAIYSTGPIRLPAHTVYRIRRPRHT